MLSLEAPSYALLVEMDGGLRRSMVEMLNCEGFQVVEETRSGPGLAQVLRCDPAIIIMSSHVTPLEGLEFLPLLRRATVAPIVMVGVDEEHAVVEALLQGADACIGSNISHAEFLSRVRALLRRTESQAGASHYAA